MSQHVLESRPYAEYHGYFISVGWATNTFFAVVLDAGDHTVLDRGGPDDRIFNPGEVLDAVRPYAAIPPGLDTTLLDEALTDTRARRSGGEAA